METFAVAPTDGDSNSLASNGGNPFTGGGNPSAIAGNTSTDPRSLLDDHPSVP